MMVLCIDDKGLPQGAEISSGKEYEVEDFFVNSWGQKVYILKGIKNEGITDKGFEWLGYAAKRFVELSGESISVSEYEDIAILN